MLKKLSLLTVLLCQSIAISSSSLVMTPGSSGVISSGELARLAPDDEDEMAKSGKTETVIDMEKDIIPLFKKHPVTDAASLKTFVETVVEKIEPYGYVGEEDLALRAMAYARKKQFIKSALLSVVLIYTLHSDSLHLLSDISLGYVDISQLPADLQIDPDFNLSKYLYNKPKSGKEGQWWQTLYKVMKIIEHIKQK